MERGLRAIAISTLSLFFSFKESTTSSKTPSLPFDTTLSLCAMSTTTVSIFLPFFILILSMTCKSSIAASLRFTTATNGPPLEMSMSLTFSFIFNIFQFNFIFQSVPSAQYFVRLTCEGREELAPPAPANHPFGNKPFYFLLQLFVYCLITLTYIKNTFPIPPFPLHIYPQTSSIRQALPALEASL